MYMRGRMSRTELLVRVVLSGTSNCFLEELGGAFGSFPSAPYLRYQLKLFLYEKSSIL